MSSILVAVDGTDENAHVIEAAVELAEEEDESLVVLHAMPPRLYDARQRYMAADRDLSYDGFTYTASQARADAKNLAERAASEAIGDRAVDYVTVGTVGNLVPTVLATAAEHGCETVFLPEETSWWRRRGGRADRRIARRFDGTVVRVPRPLPANLETVRSLPETSP